MEPSREWIKSRCHRRTYFFQSALKVLFMLHRLYVLTSSRPDLTNTHGWIYNWGTSLTSLIEQAAPANDLRSNIPSWYACLRGRQFVIRCHGEMSYCPTETAPGSWGAAHGNTRGSVYSSRVRAEEGRVETEIKASPISSFQQVLFIKPIISQEFFLDKCDEIDTRHRSDEWDLVQSLQRVSCYWIIIATSVFELISPTLSCCQTYHHQRLIKDSIKYALDE